MMLGSNRATSIPTRALPNRIAMTIAVMNEFMMRRKRADARSPSPDAVSWRAAEPYRFLQRRRQHSHRAALFRRPWRGSLIWRSTTTKEQLTAAVLMMPMRCGHPIDCDEKGIPRIESAECRRLRLYTPPERSRMRRSSGLSWRRRCRVRSRRTARRGRGRALGEERDQKQSACSTDQSSDDPIEALRQDEAAFWLRHDEDGQQRPFRLVEIKVKAISSAKSPDAVVFAANTHGKTSGLAIQAGRPTYWPTASAAGDEVTSMPLIALHQAAAVAATRRALSRQAIVPGI